jgi:hypothetical protein
MNKSKYKGLKYTDFYTWLCLFNPWSHICNRIKQKLFAICYTFIVIINTTTKKIIKPIFSSNTNSKVGLYNLKVRLLTQLT